MREKPLKDGPLSFHKQLDAAPHEPQLDAPSLTPGEVYLAFQAD